MLAIVKWTQDWVYRTKTSTEISLGFRKIESAALHTQRIKIEGKEPHKFILSPYSNNYRFVSMENSSS